jgi:hypothetical protein
LSTKESSIPFLEEEPDMDHLERLIDFLDKLEDKKIYYKLDKVRDAIMVEISVPGQKREVEFMQDGAIEIEKFMTTVEILDESELVHLFEDFSD